MTKRTETRPIKVGNIQIGQQNKVIIQSMTNTKTSDINKTIKINLTFLDITQTSFVE